MVSHHLGTDNKSPGGPQILVQQLYFHHPMIEVPLTHTHFRYENGLPSGKLTVCELENGHRNR
jgi:hypothetical protein